MTVSWTGALTGVWSFTHSPHYRTPQRWPRRMFLPSSGAHGPSACFGRTVRSTQTYRAKIPGRPLDAGAPVRRVIGVASGALHGDLVDLALELVVRRRRQLGHEEQQVLGLRGIGERDRGRAAVSYTH